MFKYLLFKFDRFYPSGGMNDLQFGFNDLEEFKTKFNFNKDYDFSEIYQVYSNLDNIKNHYYPWSISSPEYELDHETYKKQELDYKTQQYNGLLEIVKKIIKE